MDEILVTLRKLGVGCFVAGVFMGAFGYCDDLALLAPYRPAMQLMLQALTQSNPRQSVSSSVAGKDVRNQLHLLSMVESCHGCLVPPILDTC